MHVSMAAILALLVIAAEAETIEPWIFQLINKLHFFNEYMCEKSMQWSGF